MLPQNIFMWTSILHHSPLDVHVKQKYALFAASLKTLPGKSSGIKPWLRKKEYNAYFTPPDEDHDSDGGAFACQFCVPSFQKLRLVKI